MSVYVTRAGRSSRGKAKVAAFYDLDGTLASLNLLHATVFFMANLGQWSGRAGYLARLALDLPRLYMAERHDRRLLNMKLFEAYRAAGIDPGLGTGSPDFRVEPLARRLNIEHLAANRLVYSRGLATGRMLEPVMAGSEKSAWCESFAAARRIDMAGCWGYADSYYDLPFLCALGHPVAVNPDRRLLAAAYNRKWPILRFSHDAEPVRDGGSTGAWLLDWLGRA